MPVVTLGLVGLALFLRESIQVFVQRVRQESGQRSGRRCDQGCDPKVDKGVIESVRNLCACARSVDRVLSRSSQRRFTGFSLVELLISLSLGLLVLVALGQVFSSTIRTHGRTLATANLHENMRLIDAFLSRAADRAGYVGCLGHGNNVAKFLRGAWQDLPEYDLSQPVEGFENIGNGRFRPSIERLPLTSNRQRLHKSNNGINENMLAPGADILVLRGMGDLAGYVRQLPDDRSLLIEVDVHHLKPDNGDILILADCNQAALFNATGARRTGSMVSLGWNEGSGSFGNARVGTSDFGDETVAGLSLSLGGFTTASILAHVSTTVFFVGISQAADVRGNTLYSLWQKEGNSRPIELVRGVSDMQVLYGVKRGPIAGEQREVDELFLEGSVAGYYQWDEIPTGAVVASIWVSFGIESVFGVIDGRGEGGEQDYALSRSFSLTYALQNIRPRVLGVSP